MGITFQSVLSVGSSFRNRYRENIYRETWWQSVLVAHICG